MDSRQSSARTKKNGNGFSSSRGECFFLWGDFRDEKNKDEDKEDSARRDR
jgi:hypothetical protein